MTTMKWSFVANINWQKIEEKLPTEIGCNIQNGQFIMVDELIKQSKLTEDERKYVLKTTFKDAIDYSMYVETSNHIKYALDTYPNDFKIIKKDINGLIEEYECYGMKYINSELRDYYDSMRDFFY
uniref:Uncharacterized protein n=1 Tax=viral metagenome TaxID=1070528 RepID=A0A6C0ACZ3_9ZZZZ